MTWRGAVLLDVYPLSATSMADLDRDPHAFAAGVLF